MIAIALLLNISRILHIWSVCSNFSFNCRFPARNLMFRNTNMDQIIVLRAVFLYFHAHCGFTSTNKPTWDEETIVSFQLNAHRRQTQNDALLASFFIISKDYIAANKGELNWSTMSNKSVSFRSQMCVMCMCVSRKYWLLIERRSKIEWTECEYHAHATWIF